MHDLHVVTHSGKATAQFNEVVVTNTTVAMHSRTHTYPPLGYFNKPWISTASKLADADEALAAVGYRRTGDWERSTFPRDLSSAPIEQIPEGA